jgi:hypothetical protein
LEDSIHLTVEEARGLFKGLMWRDPTEEECRRLADATSYLAAIVSLMATEEFKVRNAPHLREAALEIFAGRYQPALEAEYVNLCDDFRNGRMPDIGSTDPRHVVFSAYVYCLHRPPDPFGFLEFVGNLERGNMSAEKLCRALLQSGEAQGDLEPNREQGSWTMPEIVKRLRHRSSFASVAL